MIIVVCSSIFSLLPYSEMNGIYNLRNARLTCQMPGVSLDRVATIPHKVLVVVRYSLSQEQIKLQLYNCRFSCQA